jgi:hypothetical protein
MGLTLSLCSMYSLTLVLQSSTTISRFSLEESPEKATHGESNVPLVLKVLQTPREAGALEISQEPCDNCIDRTKNCHCASTSISSSQGCQRGRDCNLETKTTIDEP